MDIRRELSANPSGWRAKEVMNILSTRKQKSNTMKFMFIGLLHKWNFSAKVPRKRGLSMLHPMRKRSNSKNSTRNYRES